MATILLSTIAVYTVTGRLQYCDHFGPMPQGSVWWCAQQAASMCIGLQARDGWWCTIPISLCVVSKCYASWCNLCKLHYLHSLKVATGEKGPRPGPLICGLCSNAEFQPREPPMWPRFFASIPIAVCTSFQTFQFIHNNYIFLWLPISSCVVSETCTNYTSLHLTDKLEF